MAVTGTFSGTGQSDWVKGKRFRIIMDFAGTASVDVEAKGHDGNAVKVPDATAITSDYVALYEDFMVGEIRLNCTAHTNNVVYSIENTEPF